MTFFLCQSKRYRQALETFDPLKGTWAIGIFDPWPKSLIDGRLSWLRITATVIFLFMPMVLFSSLPLSTTGGKMFGAGSFTADIGIFSILLFLIIAVTLLPIARRILGDLINELIRLGIVDEGLRSFDPKTIAAKGPLHWLEWLSRVNGWRGLIWYSLMLIDQVVVYWVVILRDANPTWLSADALPGSLLYFLSVGSRQPNLAGLWAFLIWGPFILYLLVVISRLVVVFACLCSAVALNPNLVISPNHPDGSGGLSIIGHCALFFSLFTFALGVDLAGITINEIVINKVFRASAVSSANLKLIFVLWLLYLVLGTVLFFVPLAPLRGRMQEAKRFYILKALQLRFGAERRHRSALDKGEVRSDAIQEIGALDGLIRTATSMAVWPFDHKSFMRYAGLLISPLTPLVLNRIPHVFAWFKTYLGL
ncbi:MAG: hypothetical protein M0Z71_04400 [Nitrospiraceae bacterium]|nr:hypothetical protein [Nitrospiraceae bacterium]